MARRRPKTFEERRQELTGAIRIITNALDDLESPHIITALRNAAIQLRALVIRKPRGPLKHPLLIELAEQAGFPLIVYTTDPVYQAKLRGITDEKPIFLSTGDVISLHEDKIFSVPMELSEAIETFSIELLGEQLSLQDVILHVADTEATHYDPGKPEIMDGLERIGMGGLPSHYRVIFSLAKVVRELGIRLLQATT